MPNFEDFELDLRKVKTNNSTNDIVTRISEAICTEVSRSMIEKSLEINCSVRGCASAGCSGGDMTVGCYAANREGALPNC